MKRIDSSIFFEGNPKSSRVIAAISDMGEYSDRLGEVFCDIERDFYDSAEIEAVYELESCRRELTQNACKYGKCWLELIRL